MNKHKQVLQKLEKLTFDRFYQATEEFSIPKKKVDKLISDLTKAKEAGQTELVVMKFVTTNLKLKSESDMDNATILIREIQAVDNHIVFCNNSSGGECNSSFQENIVHIKQEMERNIPKDLEAFMKLVYEAHVTIDKFLIKEENKNNKDREDFFKRMQKLERDNPGILDDDELDYYKNFDYKNISRTAHHTLDWYLQADPFTSYRKTPKRVAAIAIAVMLRFNQEFADQYEIFEKQNLAKLGGWKSASSINSSLYRAYPDLCSEVVDPQLLFIDCSTARENWREDFDAQFSFEDEIDYNEYMPAIRLKYFSTASDTICDNCKKPCDVVGVKLNGGKEGDEKFLCEDCAVKAMYDNDHFAEYLIQHSQRRRMFDVTYLLTELLMDKYLVDNKLPLGKLLPEKEMKKMIESSTNLWNKKFSSEERTNITQIKKQKEIEKIFKKKIDDMM